jgi:hypothetical protein
MVYRPRTPAVAAAHPPVVYLRRRRASGAHRRLPGAEPETTRISKPVNQIDWDRDASGTATPTAAEIRAADPGNTLRGHLLEDEGTARVSGLNLSDDQLKQVSGS